jgi:hypothetical protein
MATERQIAANRRNAQKSTGPNTPQGKAASRFNATRHGFAGEHFALAAEDKQEFDDVRGRDLKFGAFLSNVSRYEFRLERSFYRALNQLKALQSARAQEPEELASFGQTADQTTEPATNPPQPDPAPAPRLTIVQNPHTAVENSDIIPNSLNPNDGPSGMSNDSSQPVENNHKLELLK